VALLKIAMDAMLAGIGRFVAQGEMNLPLGAFHIGD
jgi:hypothetical protein